MNAKDKALFEDWSSRVDGDYLYYEDADSVPVPMAEKVGKEKRIHRSRLVEARDEGHVPQQLWSALRRTFKELPA